MPTIKEALKEIADQLPDECTWDDVMYQVYVRQQVETGLADADAGRIVSHEDVFAEFKEAGR